MTISRLSDRKIDDPFIRSYLYKDILKAVRENSVTCTPYEIKADERYRPDLVSQRIYGSTSSRWLVKLLCGVEDEELPLPVGSTFLFPEAGYIRERIRHYENGGGL